MAIAWENIIGGGNVEDNQPPPNAYSMFSQLFHNLRQNTKSKIAPSIRCRTSVWPAGSRIKDDFEAGRVTPRSEDNELHSEQQTDRVQPDRPRVEASDLKYDDHKFLVPKRGKC